MWLEMAMVISMLNSPTPYDVEREHHCLIENAIYETIGEGMRGMQLATEVVLNRFDANYRGATTLCGVIYAPAQFSWTLKPKAERRAYTEQEYLKAAQVVFSVIYNQVPKVLDAQVLHYQNPKTATDRSWYQEQDVVLVHGNHHFIKIK